jgi:RNA polymerase sigma-70 factor (ECF subfamily)
MTESPSQLPTDPAAPEVRTEQFVRHFAACENELYRYVFMLHPHAADAADIMQDTAAALWQKFDQYRTGEPFFRWACSFAYLQVLKHRERQRRSHRALDPDVIALLAADWPREQPLADLRRAALARCLSLLTPRQRELIDLRYGRSQSIADLARTTNRPANTLYKSLERIRRQLVDCITRRLAQEVAR